MNNFAKRNPKMRTALVARIKPERASVINDSTAKQSLLAAEHWINGSQPSRQEMNLIRRNVIITNR